MDTRPIILLTIALFIMGIGTASAQFFTVTTIETVVSPNTLISGSATIILPANDSVTANNTKIGWNSGAITWSGWTYEVGEYSVTKILHGTDVYTISGDFIEMGYFVDDYTTQPWNRWQSYGADEYTFINHETNLWFEYSYSGGIFEPNINRATDVYIGSGNRQVTFYSKSINLGDTTSISGYGVYDGTTIAVFTGNVLTIYPQEASVVTVAGSNITSYILYNRSAVIGYFAILDGSTAVVSNPAIGSYVLTLSSGLAYTNTLGWNILASYAGTARAETYPITDGNSIVFVVATTSSDASLVINTLPGRLPNGVYFMWKAGTISLVDDSNVSLGTSPSPGNVKAVFYMPPTAGTVITGQPWQFEDYVVGLFGFFKYQPIYIAVNVPIYGVIAYENNGEYTVATLYLPTKTTFTYTLEYLLNSTAYATAITATAVITSSSITKTITFTVTRPPYTSVSNGGEFENVQSNTTFTFEEYSQFQFFYTCYENSFPFNDYYLATMAYSNTVVIVDWGADIGFYTGTAEIAGAYVYNYAENGETDTDFLIGTWTTSGTITVVISTNYTYNDDGVEIYINTGTLFTDGTKLFAYSISQGAKDVTKTTWFTSTSSTFSSSVSGITVSSSISTSTIVYYNWWIGEWIKKTRIYYYLTFYSNGTYLGGALYIISSTTTNVSEITDYMRSVYTIIGGLFETSTNSFINIEYQGSGTFFEMNLAIFYKGYFSTVTTMVPAVIGDQITFSNSLDVSIYSKTTVCKNCIHVWVNKVSYMESTWTYSSSNSTYSAYYYYAEFNASYFGELYIPPQIFEILQSISPQQTRNICTLLGMSQSDVDQKVVVNLAAEAPPSSSSTVFNKNYYPETGAYIMRFTLFTDSNFSIQSVVSGDTVVLPFYTSSITVYYVNESEFFVRVFYISKAGNIQYFYSASSGIMGVSPVVYANAKGLDIYYTAYVNATLHSTARGWINYYGNIFNYLVVIPCETCTATSTTVNYYVVQMKIPMKRTSAWLGGYVYGITPLGIEFTTSGVFSIYKQVFSLQTESTTYIIYPVGIAIATVYVPANATNGIAEVNAGAMRAEYVVLIGFYYSFLFLLIFAALMLMLTRKRKYLYLAIGAVLIMAVIYMYLSAADYISGDFFILKTRAISTITTIAGKKAIITGA